MNQVGLGQVYVIGERSCFHPFACSQVAEAHFKRESEQVLVATLNKVGRLWMCKFCASKLRRVGVDPAEFQRALRARSTQPKSLT